MNGVCDFLSFVSFVTRSHTHTHTHRDKHIHIAWHGRDWAALALITGGGGGFVFVVVAADIIAALFASVLYPSLFPLLIHI